MVANSLVAAKLSNQSSLAGLSKEAQTNVQLIRGHYTSISYNDDPMQIVGRVESLWRYPVKSMRGEELQEAYVGFAGVYGDRMYAFRSSAAPKKLPYLTGRDQERMLLYRPVFRNAVQMRMPPNLVETQTSALGLTTANPEPDACIVDVETPRGEKLAIDDPQLIENLREGIPERHQLRLTRSDRAMTDCRPVSLLSIQTVRQLSQELGANLDKRRFRCNIYIDLESGSPFFENDFVGHTLHIGNKVVIAVTDRDPRCKMITLDPDTAQPNPEIMRHVARVHDGKVAVYAAVLVQGTIRPGDVIQLA